MRVLVACEFSGRVRDAFRDLGHDSWSCDLQATDSPGQHLIGDVRQYLKDGWDLMIAHPPCTHLAASGARHLHKKFKQTREALEFVKCLLEADIPRIALENPVGRISTAIRKPDQVIQPWMFGHAETKATCLWLKNLPLLTPTNIVKPVRCTTLAFAQSPSRGRLRSITPIGIARAMAEQWGCL